MLFGPAVPIYEGLILDPCIIGINNEALDQLGGWWCIAIGVAVWECDVKPFIFKQKTEANKKLPGNYKQLFLSMP